MGKDTYHIKICVHPSHVVCANKMLLFAGANRISSRIRHLYGNHIAVADYVDIGQILISVQAKDANRAHVIEAICRGKFKFAGRQKILRSNKWGFTKYPRSEYVALRKAGVLTADGNIVKVHNRRGRLEKSSLYQNNKE